MTEELQLLDYSNESDVETALPIETRTPIEVALDMDKDGFTTAKKLYNWLELDDAHYARWVKTNILENPYADEGSDYSPIRVSKKQGRGNFAIDYKLSASFAKKLAMSTRSVRGEQARIYFLQCEKTLMLLAEERQKHMLERAKGIGARLALTDVIMQSGENERMKGHGYSVYTDLVYKVVLGMTAKQYRERHGLAKRDSIRDNLSAEELAEVSKAEQLVSSLVNTGFSYARIKDILMERGRKALSCSA